MQRFPANNRTGSVYFGFHAIRICLLLFAERHGWLGGEEPQHRVPQIIGRRGADGGSLRRRAQSSVGPPQVGVRRRLLTS